MASNGPFKEGPSFRRVYDKNDIVVQAMLDAGLEEYISNGFFLEEIDDEQEQKEEDSVRYDGIQTDSTVNLEQDLSKDLQETSPVAPVEPMAASKTSHSNKTLKYKNQLAKSYYMEQEIRKRNKK